MGWNCMGWDEVLTSHERFGHVYNVYTVHRFLRILLHPVRALVPYMPGMFSFHRRMFYASVEARTRLFLHQP